MEVEGRLRCVVVALGAEWRNKIRVLAHTLSEEGITCVEAGENPDYLKKLLCGFMDVSCRDGVVVLTDCEESAHWLAQNKIVYFACVRPETEGMCSDSGDTSAQAGKRTEKSGHTVWLDRAPVALEGFMEVDGRFLEEWLLRAQGLPVVIARTKRLLIREITQQDLPGLLSIGGQAGVRNVMREDCLSEEWLSSYIKYAYRLQGYGLWSVVYNGRVIGCCGFGPVDTGEAGTEQRLCLELQYVLDESCRRQGFGTEMCQSAISYAITRLAVQEIWIVIQRGNSAAAALADRLDKIFPDLIRVMKL